MFKPSLTEIVDVLKSKNYKVFNGKNYDLNVVGIRSKNKESNKFDDTLVVFYMYNNFYDVHYYQITTDPGLYYLNTPLSSKGTAILKPGQYFKAFNIGYHRGKYKALVQNSPLTVYRDNTKDNILHTDISHANVTEETGMFGINIHCAKWMGKSINVDKWSAGCQVFADWNEFQDFMTLAELGLKNYPGGLTYTLIEENDFK